MKKFSIGYYEDQEAVEENNITKLPGEMDLDTALNHLQGDGFGGVMYENKTGRSFIVDPKKHENEWIIELFRGGL